MTLQIVTTVVTPAPSYDLVSLALVKAEIGITAADDDMLLAAWIARASAAAGQYCNRVFAPETVRDVVFFERDSQPWQVPGGAAPLQLSRWPLLPSPEPVVSVADVALTIDDDFVVDASKGQLVRLSPSVVPTIWASLPTTITYCAGFDPIPVDVQDAVIRLVKARWYARRRDPNLKREEIPGVRTAEWWIDTSPQRLAAMPPEVVDLLDNYRIPVVA